MNLIAFPFYLLILCLKIVFGALQFDFFVVHFIQVLIQ